MKKIMFNDKYGLTQAVLSGRKTMTRRIVNNIDIPIDEMRVSSDGTCKYKDPLNGFWYDCDKQSQPKFFLFEEIAIAQSYKDAGWDANTLQEAYVKTPTIFPDLDEYEKMSGIIDLPFKYHKGWNNKMFVKADLMPHAIEITNIKVERLQDCSDNDILKEGVFQISAPIYRHSNGIGYTFKGWTERGVECSSDTPKGAFKALIDKVSGKGTWESNPWCFCYEFKLVK